ncbi:MAG: TonB-dependent receptor [Saprospiraceae bacterium]|jgi:TonB-linked SusC/RagA family outer membrane protein
MLKPLTNLLFTVCLVFFATLAVAQRSVSGKVTDAKTAEPLIGANVLIKGTSSGTITDIDGNYTVDGVKEGDHLVFSYAGYEDVDATVGSQSTMDVSLSPGAILEEVVVVGYGIQKKSVVTGAISSLKTKDLEKVPSGRVEQSLQGRVSGVTIAQNSGQPGSPSTIRIRGITTFGDGGNNPLWVVDGVVVDAGAIGYLNQNDIESVEVLKDAASAAIYGTRAATGVILVTTKKGKEGKLNVNYTGFVGSSAPTKVLKLLNASQYAALINERSVAGGGNLVFPSINLGLGTDWQKQIFDYGAKRYSHELSISGGNATSTYYVSAGMLDQQGIVASDISQYNRKSIRLNSTHKLSKVFTFGQTLGYAHVKDSGVGGTDEYGGVLSSAINLDPITPVIETDEVLAAGAPYNSNPVVRDANGNPYGISPYVGQEMKNPVAYIQTRLGNYNWADDIIGNAFLEAAITDNIKVKSTVGAKKSFWGNVSWSPLYFLSATNLTNQNTYGQANNSVFNWNIENTITYDDKFGDHHFNVLLGQGAYVDGIGGGTSNSMSNLPIKSYKDASFNFDIPQTSRTSGTYSFVEHKLSSLFARVNYDLKEKYLFTGILRRDGSSRFGGNNKYGVFPSVSVGWNVSREEFWNQDWFVTNLKLRGGYGVVGNDNIRNFAYLSTVNGGSNYTFGTSGVITTGYSNLTLDNPNLRWEETSQSNIGFNAELFNNLSIGFDLFNKKTSGILRPVVLPGFVGVNIDPSGNVADMTNKGFEVELGYKKSFGEFNVSANGSFSYIKNEVTNIALDTATTFIAGEATFQSMGQVTRTEAGQSYNSFYGYHTNGIFQNEAEIAAYKSKDGVVIQPNARPGDFKWVDQDGNGKIDSDDKVFLGSNLPKYTFGLTLNLDYKAFDLMVFGQGAAGNKIFQGLRRLDIATSNYQTKALSRWHGEGTSNTFPRLTSSDTNGNFTNMSDFYLEDGAYLRLKILQLGYTLPMSISNRISSSKIRLYFTGENLFTFTKYTGYDPEIGGGVFGIDKGYYPQARSFLFGAQVQF